MADEEDTLRERLTRLETIVSDRLCPAVSRIETDVQHVRDEVSDLAKNQARHAGEQEGWFGAAGVTKWIIGGLLAVIVSLATLVAYRWPMQEREDLRHRIEQQEAQEAHVRAED